MSDLYLWLRIAHILSATLLFGTGTGTAFFMWRAHRSGDVAHIATTARHVVAADWLFTAIPGVVQLATGLWLVREAGYALTEPWLLLALALFLLALGCWLPVAWLQIRMRDLANAASAANAALPAAYGRYFRVWFALGWPAFAAVLAIFVLMVFRPDL